MNLDDQANRDRDRDRAAAASSPYGNARDIFDLELRIVAVEHDIVSIKEDVAEIRVDLAAVQKTATQILIAVVVACLMLLLNVGLYVGKVGR